jgi:hypothetical protein
MWQNIIVAALVLAAAVYAARTLGPRRWRRRVDVGSTGGVAGGDCGCGKDGKSCH